MAHYPPKTKGQLAREGKFIPKTFLSKEKLYPHMSTKKDKERHCECFLEIFKQLNITISISYALELMSVYSKSMKDFLTKKKVSEIRA